jgi:hypothetical protein
VDVSIVLLKTNNLRREMVLSTTLRRPVHPPLLLTGMVMGDNSGAAFQEWMQVELDTGKGVDGFHYLSTAMVFPDPRSKKVVVGEICRVAQKQSQPRGLAAIHPPPPAANPNQRTLGPMGSEWMRRGVEWRTITRILYEETGNMNRHEQRGRTCYAINSWKKRAAFRMGRYAGGARGAVVGKKDSTLGYMGYAVYTFGPTNHKPARLVSRVEAQKTLRHTNVG